MDLSSDQIAAIEAKMAELGRLDPADLPQPASDLVAMLSAILGEAEEE